MKMVPHHTSSPLFWQKSHPTPRVGVAQVLLPEPALVDGADSLTHVPLPGGLVVTGQDEQPPAVAGLETDAEEQGRGGGGHFFSLAALFFLILSYRCCRFPYLYFI